MMRFYRLIVDYLILEPNCYVAMLVYRILLACCLLVIFILSVTRKKVCEHFNSIIDYTLRLFTTIIQPQNPEVLRL